MKAAKVVIVTGMSGSGKSVAAKALEDLGFFCVDNLPADLVDKLIQLGTLSRPGDLGKFALIMDLRDPTFPSRAVDLFHRLRQDGYQLDILFLEASDEVLQRRYSETRRAHPQAGSGSAIEGIRAERDLLLELRGQADWVLDTTGLTPHELRRRIQNRFADESSQALLVIRLMSFGFKYGLPGDADLVMDVRFLPNPHFVEDLRPLTGKDAAVADYVLQSEKAQDFLKRYVDLLAFLIPLYRGESKSYLTIAIGCTGGKHRSVAIVEHLAENLGKMDITLAVEHRDYKR
ncbi:MAG: RNase adapter RapZ [Candidatus Lernaella stagnicola]|nr:RNase adapter RapZ [Candidatus Lernaella stagnicola]